MPAIWPWLMLAASGALHGAAPTNGWMFAAARGVRADDERQVRRALWPLAFGHAASIALVAGAVALGGSMDRSRVQCLAGGLLIGVAALQLVGAGPRRFAERAGPTGLAIWSFLMATAHGAGLMLVPALAPLCLSGNPARRVDLSGSFALALAAVAVHTAAWLATTGFIATGVCRGVSRHPRWSKRVLAGRSGWGVILAASGAALVALG